MIVGANWYLGNNTKSPVAVFQETTSDAAPMSPILRSPPSQKRGFRWYVLPPNSPSAFEIILG